jgi:hypothetical protein
MNRTDLQTLSETRLREANALFAVQEYSGCYYLAGYAIECALRSCIAKETREFDFPDKDRAHKSYSHSPLELVKVADLYSDLQISMRANPLLEARWTVVIKWSEQSRYQIWNETDAKALLGAVTDANGVLPWIKQRW